MAIVLVGYTSARTVDEVEVRVSTLVESTLPSPSTRFSVHERLNGSVRSVTSTWATASLTCCTTLAGPLTVIDDGLTLAAFYQ